MESKGCSLPVKSIQVCRYLFQNRFLTVHTGVSYALLVVFISFHLRPVAQFCIAQGHAVMPWIFPFMTSDYMLQIFLIAGAILLVADAPFSDENRLYMLYRTGLVDWQLGTFLYMTVVAVVYVVSIWGIAFLTLADVVQFSFSWGKILGSLMQTSLGQEYGIPLVFHYAVSQYTPVQAMIYSMCLEALCILWLGMLVYIGNAFVRHRAGVFLAFGYLFLDVVAYNAMPRSVYRFSPLSLCQLGYFDGDFAREGLSMAYAGGFFCGSILLFAIVIMFIENQTRIVGNLRKRGAQDEKHD